MAVVFIVCFLLISGIIAEKGEDTREGEEVTLECRFAPLIAGKNPKYFWLRTNKRNHDNVAVQDTPLESNYRIDFRPELGRYDLLISNTSYDRDNGKFECRVKAAGSGTDLHSQGYMLTVLTPPGPPRVSPGSSATVTEGKPLELTCESAGGSPEPHIKWYREGYSQPLDAPVRRTQEDVTMAVLTLNPTKDDERAVFRCVVWNRAMPNNSKMEASVSLNVNYFPRVTIGPENPLRVERDGTTTLTCDVDAKPKVTNVRWSRNGRFIATSFSHSLLRVGIVDAGKYTCTADNGLGESGSAEIVLDVLYPPTVTIESAPGAARHREAEEGESVNVKCNVSANPAPYIVEWLREGHPGFRQSGEVLRLSTVSAESAGTYICRAVNVLTPSQSKRRMEKVGNATMTLLVRHKPGVAHISPERPIASEGTGVTLTCSANPPGWPQPQYRWWRDTDASSQGGSPQTVLATGPKYMIPSAHMGSEGRYHCQATNEMGHGEPSSVVLQVHQPPRLIAKLQPHVTRRAGSADFSVKCGAQGKPKPQVRWLKDGKEIGDENQSDYEVANEESDGRNSVFTVQTTLRFTGRNRPDGNQLVAADRGVYSCAFVNEVKRTESSMHLRIEHEPIILHQYNKVAYDIRETAEVVCRVQAYPRPEFQWSLVGNSAPLSPSSGLDSHYDITTTAESNDVYTSILRITNVQESDYGEYTCRIGNGLGSLKTGIRLQPKGAPEAPSKIRALYAGPNFLTLSWSSGFDGGITATKFFVSYKRDGLSEKCLGGSSHDRRNDWQESDCQAHNPCNVTSLEPHHTYKFKVKAYNTKGNSNYSDVETASTKVDRIPAPLRVSFHPASRSLSLNLPATCLQLQAEVQAETSTEWLQVDTVHVEPGAADAATVLPSAITGPPRLRVRLCLQTNPDFCGDFVPAEIGPSFVAQSSSLATPTLIAIIVSCVVFVLFAGLLVMFCRCKKQSIKKEVSKEYEMEPGVRPSIVQQPPPPYYPEAKPEEVEQSKWVNMGYHENSYSNSVHSQDSLWAMKMANGNNNAHAQSDPQQSGYGYDPLTHGGYDYAPYDPYGPVHKQKKLPAHMSDMSGLPDPYMGAMELEEPKNQHVSLSFDESLESGYSTPNSRNRRIIREIIV